MPNHTPRKIKSDVTLEKMMLGRHASLSLWVAVTFPREKSMLNFKWVTS